MSLRELLQQTDLPPEVCEQLEAMLAEHDRLLGDVGILRATLDSMSEGLVVSDAAGNFVVFNKEAESILGIGPRAGGPDAWSATYGLFLPDGDTPFPPDRYPIVLAARGESTDDVEMLVRNARWPEGRALRVSGRPWRTPQGKILGGVVVFRDVTELKRAWAALRTVNKQLEQRVEERTRELEQTQAQLFQVQKFESLGRLSGGIAHDFNNLIMAITGHAEMLLAREHLTPGDRTSIVEIQRASERAAELTRQLLAFSRKKPIRSKPVAVNRVIAGLEPMLMRLLGEPVRMVLDLAPGLPPAQADTGQLEQVVMNLAINARDAMPQGGTLTIRTAQRQLTAQRAGRQLGAAPGAYVEIAVSDEGTGMGAETLAHIFEPLFTTKREGAGTGFGLSTVYGIVKQHAGDIAVASEPGRGTAFRVYLPLARELAVPAGAPADAAAAGGKETILVAEDEDAVRELVRAMLEAQGYRVLTATDGAEALRLAETHPGAIDLLLTDSVMPHTSGYALASQMCERRSGMRVLYMSGDPERAAEGAFLAKPFTPLQLMQRAAGDPRPPRSCYSSSPRAATLRSVQLEVSSER